MKWKPNYKETEFYPCNTATASERNYRGAGKMDFVI